MQNNSKIPFAENKSHKSVPRCGFIVRTRLFLTSTYNSLSSIHLSIQNQFGYKLNENQSLLSISSKNRTVCDIMDNSSPALTQHETKRLDRNITFLEKEFRKCRRPSLTHRVHLSSHLGVTLDFVTHWFEKKLMLVDA